jgi:hypothetical protein
VHDDTLEHDFAVDMTTARHAARIALVAGSDEKADQGLAIQGSSNTKSAFK